MTKRRRIDKRVKTEDGTEEKTNTFTRIIDKIKVLKDGNRLRAAQFLHVPSKRQYPEYYEEIEHPISLQEIQTKVNKKRYASPEEFLQDFNLMADNARTFNDKESEIARDAQIIYEVARDSLAARDATADAGIPASSSSSKDKNKSFDFKQAQIDVVNQLINYKIKGRRLSDIFMVEPSKAEYPVYYKIIKKATSFTTILQQIEQGKTPTLESFLDAVNLMFSNAKTFNEEGSIVYQDAVTLEKLFNSKVDKLRQQVPPPSSPSSIKLKLHTPASTKLKLSLKKKEDESYEEEKSADEEMSPAPTVPATTAEATPEVAAATAPSTAPVQHQMPPATLQQQQQLTMEEIQRQQQQQQMAGGQIPGVHPGMAGMAGMANVPPAMPMPVPDVEHRRIGKSVEDALLKCIDITSSVPLPTWRYAQNGLKLPADAGDMFQVVIPASKSHVISSYSFNLASYHNTLIFTVLLDPSLAGRYYNLSLTHQNRRVTPIISANTWVDSVKFIKERFEVRLAPGLNHIAITANAGGFRQQGVPPGQEAGEITDMEKVTLWLNLSRWPFD